MPLPPFFANVLPEGALRELIEREFGAGDFDDSDVLARLREDLPGAVVARQESGKPAAYAPGLQPVDKLAPEPIRFSKLKFSMRSDRSTITVSATGADGDVILITPSPKYPKLPEMEFSAMSLCRAIGIRTADVWLIDSYKVQGIPTESCPLASNALRFVAFIEAVTAGTRSRTSPRYWVLTTPRNIRRPTKRRSST